MEISRKEEANVAARIHAIGWSGLMSSFGGDKVDFIDLLPYPELLKESDRRISKQTEAIVKDLIQNQKLPSKLLSALNVLV